MRKLGRGQSVMFIGPPEIENRIIRRTGKDNGEPIEVIDVLDWSISETWAHTRRCIPLWAMQGLRYQRHSKVWSELLEAGAERSPIDIAQSFLEREALSIEKRYSVENTQPEERILLQHIDGESCIGDEIKLNAIREKCREFDLTSFEGATVQEMQERELSPETECERQVERPPALTPAEHSLHEEVKRFIEHGVLNPCSTAIQPAFKTLRRTSASAVFEKDAWPSNLLVTADFARTVETPKMQNLDFYLRPVHWVVSRRTDKGIEWVVLSPYEVSELLPIIQNSKQRTTTLHVYSPRTSLSKRTLEDLAFCTIPAAPLSAPPSSIARVLNLFAGQIYLKSHDEYLALCRFLGLCYRENPGNGEIRIACDGFIEPLDRNRFDELMSLHCRFTRSPVEFLRILMTLRRKGLTIEKSHIGFLLGGRLIGKEDLD
jgi:hypothetical protein